MNQSSAVGAVGHRDGGVDLDKADGAQMISITPDADRDLQGFWALALLLPAIFSVLHFGMEMFIIYHWILSFVTFFYYFLRVQSSKIALSLRKKNPKLWTLTY